MAARWCWFSPCAARRRAATGRQATAGQSIVMVTHDPRGRVCGREPGRDGDVVHSLPPDPGSPYHQEIACEGCGTVVWCRHRAEEIALQIRQLEAPPKARSG